MKISDQFKYRYNRQDSEQIEYEKVRDHLIQNKAPDCNGRGSILSRNQVISCLYISGGSASESNPPTSLVAMHNGFEIRCYSYQPVRLGPLTWGNRRGLYQYVREPVEPLIGKSHAPESNPSTCSG